MSCVIIGVPDCRVLKVQRFTGGLCGSRGEFSQKRNYARFSNGVQFLFLSFPMIHVTKQRRYTGSIGKKVLQRTIGCRDDGVGEAKKYFEYGW